MRLPIIAIILIAIQIYAVLCQDDCVDRFPNCGSLADTLCETPQMRDDICRKTCGTCGKCGGKCDQLCDEATNSCRCHSGYTLVNGSTCVDINECTSTETTICNTKERSICHNTEGSFTCLKVEDKCVQEEGFTTYYGQEETTCCKQTTSSGVFGKCGINVENVKPGKIVGGKDARAAMWPWMAYLRISGQLCGGALINDRWVISASHCFTANLEGDKSPIELTFGMTTVSDTSETTRQKRFSKQVIIHEKYDYPRYDIALVELDQPVKWSKFVTPICLPNGEVPRPGVKCFATGYGTTAFRGNVTDTLQEVDLPIINTTTCVKRYENDLVTVDPDLMVCAGYKEGGKDACQGDSGGPLVCQRCDSCDYYLAGVTSFGKGCALPNNYGVYTNVESLENWIASKISSVTITKKKCIKKEWSDWQPWGACNKLCDTGLQSRMRFCLNGIAGQDGCFGDSIQFKHCNTQNCSAPVPKWGKYSGWSQCTQTCGSGSRIRVRKCIGGNPGDGKCLGSDKETQVCNSQPCPTWSDWTYNQCSVTCGSGSQTGTRTCMNGPGCIGEATMTRTCTPRACVKVWSQWATCSVTCGNGVETRKCLSCETSEEETRPCEQKACPKWSKWGDWSVCTKSCGRGTQKAKRNCLNGAVGEEGCIGSRVKNRKCNTEACPVPFELWSEWSDCTLPCGSGEAKRTRTCSKTSCIEDEFGSVLEQTRKCNTHNCPKWGPWGPFGVCTKKCGGGSRTQTRTCIDGPGCVGNAERREKCNEMPCVAWGNWGEWGDCTATCGPATSTRTRACNKIDDTMDCVGVGSEVRSCNHTECPELCSTDCQQKVVAESGCLSFFDITFFGCPASCCDCKDDPAANCDLLSSFSLECFTVASTAYACKYSCGLCTVI